MATNRKLELVLRESGQWAIFVRTGSRGRIVDTGHVDRKLAELDLDFYASSRTLSPIGQGWLNVADRLASYVKAGRYRHGQTTDILNRADMLTLLMEQDYACPVSGSYFTHDAFDGEARNPFQPSVDRIDPARGYERDNVRIVALLVNLAMADWGAEPLLEIARRIVAREETPGLRPVHVSDPVVGRSRLRLTSCE